jgi:hypothetical protein
MSPVLTVVVDLNIVDSAYQAQACTLRLLWREVKLLVTLYVWPALDPPIVSQAKGVPNTSLHDGQNESNGIIICIHFER